MHPIQILSDFQRLSPLFRCVYRCWILKWDGLSEKSERDRLTFSLQILRLLSSIALFANCSNVINAKSTIIKYRYNFFIFWCVLRDFSRKLETRMKQERKIDWSLFYFKLFSEIDFFLYAKKNKKDFLRIFSAKRRSLWTARTVENYA